MTTNTYLIAVVTYGTIVDNDRIKRDFFLQIHICEAHAMVATREGNA